MNDNFDAIIEAGWNEFMPDFSQEEIQLLGEIISKSPKLREMEQAGNISYSTKEMMINLAANDAVNRKTVEYAVRHESSGKDYVDFARSLFADPDGNYEWHHEEKYLDSIYSPMYLNVTALNETVRVLPQVVPVYTKEQLAQLEEARLFIPDRQVLDVIANPNLTSGQMKTLVYTACSHPLAAVDFFELNAEQTAQMDREIREEVRELADGFLKQNASDRENGGGRQSVEGRLQAAKSKLDGRRTDAPDKTKIAARGQQAR